MYSSGGENVLSITYALSQYALANQPPLQSLRFLTVYIQTLAKTLRAPLIEKSCVMGLSGHPAGKGQCPWFNHRNYAQHDVQPYMSRLEVLPTTAPIFI